MTSNTLQSVALRWLHRCMLGPTAFKAYMSVNMLCANHQGTSYSTGVLLLHLLGLPMISQLAIFTVNLCCQSLLHFLLNAVLDLDSSGLNAMTLLEECLHLLQSQQAQGNRILHQLLSSYALLDDFVCQHHQLAFDCRSCSWQRLPWARNTT